MSKMLTNTSANGIFFPLIMDKKLSSQKLDDFLAVYNETYSNGHKNILEHSSYKELLEPVFSCSPYLTKLFFKYPEFSYKLLQQKPEELTTEIFTHLTSSLKQITSIDQLMKLLRIAKAHMALTLGFADLSAIWTLDKITKNLSDFAEISLNLTVNFLIDEALKSGQLSHHEDQQKYDIFKASQKSGYVILAMGKLGGFELNYSSDIDLIVLFDKDIIKYSGRKSSQDFFIKLTKKMVKIMSDRTEDGYVFRTDLNLRPDPGATPVALSMEGAEVYYQSVGLNWERAAMIKARPVAGDIKAGYEFLERIRGFVWRKHLDYAALDDIHAMKKLIHKHHSHGQIKLAGHDLKLGRGGIREIEFFAQIHQLISGGREIALRIAPTCLALKALTRAGKLSNEDNQILQKSYIYLRTLEHRLQMINDEQTHEIPTSDLEIERIMKFMGYATMVDFNKELLEHLNAVHIIFNALLRDNRQTDDSHEDNSLIFPPDSYNADTLMAIEQAGFGETKKIYDLIQNWQLGRYRACRTDRARLLLKQLIPDILKAFGSYNDPDGGLVKFDDFLSRLPSGVQLFSFIKAQPWLLDLLAQIIGIAPFLSNQLSRRPLLLDSVLSTNYFDKKPQLDKLEANLNEQMIMSRDFQDTLDITRKWAGEGKFLLGLQLLRGNCDVVCFGKSLSYIAQLTLIALLDDVKKEFAIKHGIIENSSIAILAMGKLGGYEFTTTSDVDMILIYDAADMDVLSNGSKQLTVNHYYARLCQNFINSVSALTAEGKLYEIDMRLRPSGTAGPLAVSIESFNDYQNGQAWTWEHMALIRGRVIYGPKSLKEKIEKCIINTLSNKKRDQENLLFQVDKMRKKLIDNFPTKNIWSMKHMRGGIIDIEFICQYLLLKHGAKHPKILVKNTLDQISALIENKILSKNEGEKLYRSCFTLQSIQAMLRLCLGSTSKQENKPQALLDTLSHQLNYPADQLTDLILDVQKFTLDLYEKIIEIPASKIKPDKADQLLNKK